MAPVRPMPASTTSGQVLTLEQVDAAGARLASPVVRRSNTLTFAAGGDGAPSGIFPSPAGAAPALTITRDGEVTLPRAHPLRRPVLQIREAEGHVRPSPVHVLGDRVRGFVASDREFLSP